MNIRESGVAESRYDKLIAHIPQIFDRIEFQRDSELSKPQMIAMQSFEVF